jgi:hypothetical protein
MVLRNCNYENRYEEKNDGFDAGSFGIYVLYGWSCIGEFSRWSLDGDGGESEV